MLIFLFGSFGFFFRLVYFSLVFVIYFNSGCFFYYEFVGAGSNLVCKCVNFGKFYVSIVFLGKFIYKKI